MRKQGSQIGQNAGKIFKDVNGEHKIIKLGRALHRTFSMPTAISKRGSVRYQALMRCRISGPLMLSGRDQIRQAFPRRLGHPEQSHHHRKACSIEHLSYFLLLELLYSMILKYASSILPLSPSSYLSTRLDFARLISKLPT